MGSLFLALSRTFRFVLCGHKTDRVSVCALVLFSALLFASLSFLLEEQERSARQNVFRFCCLLPTSLGFSLRHGWASKRVISLKVWLRSRRTSECCFLFCGAQGFVFSQGRIFLVWPLRGRIEEERQRSHTLFHSPLVVVPKRRDVASSHGRGCAVAHVFVPYLVLVCAWRLGVAAFTRVKRSRGRAAHGRLARLERFVDVQLTSLLLVVIGKR